MKRKRPRSNPKKNKPQPKGGPQGEKKCHYCGHQYHDRTVCPAINVRNEGTIKMFASQVTPLVKRESINLKLTTMMKLTFTSWVKLLLASAEYWRAKVDVNDNPTVFKLDTGAAVSVISDQEPWVHSQQLTKSKQGLRGPGGTNLPVVGTFEASLKYQDKETKETLNVLKNQPQSLLSRNACVKLGLMRTEEKVEEVIYNPTPDFRAEFPKLFKGLGKMETEYRITLKPDSY